ncbi:MAG: PBP1A family penicillin-binding protein [Spirochaetes bacterium]|nr:PBP1A family penicillin-binding protein [Spirochaetota bacterium]
MTRYRGLKNRLLKPSYKKTKAFSYESSFDIENYFERISLWVRDFYHEKKPIVWGIVVGLFIAFAIIIFTDFLKVKNLATYTPSVTTKIYDKNGELAAELFRQKREIVEYKKIPRQLIQAFIAIEDNEFYEHFGINIKGIVRAFFINIFSGRIRQGGSTITQQLAKILLTSGERSVYRKIKEAIIALMMEFYYSKDEIMSLYLNQIFMGHGAYGVESAARFYFQKHVWELNLAECSLLAAIVSAPNRYSPIRHPNAAMERHKIVLAKMVELGYLTIEQAEHAYISFWPEYYSFLSSLPPTYNVWSTRLDRCPWFTEYVRRELVKKFGEEVVYEQGLEVYTTMDLKKQIAAQEIMAEAIKLQTSVSSKLAIQDDDYFIEEFTDPVELYSLLFNVNPFQKSGSTENRRISRYVRQYLLEEIDLLNYVSGFSNISELFDDFRKKIFDEREYQNVEGCLISIDHRTGYIEALVGGSEFTSQNQINRALQSRRQPGSAIKPLLFAAAIETGEYSPATLMLDSPVIYTAGDGIEWEPENYTSEFKGFTTLRTALELSINVVAVRLAEAIGIDAVLNGYYKLLNFTTSEDKSRIPRNFSIAIGSFDVTPFELARAYAIIANGGNNVIPFAIRQVKDRNGKILENTEADIRKTLQEMETKGTLRIIKPETAQILISMLRSVIQKGTARAAGIGRPAAGKTGSTNNWRDAWFVGFTPQLTTCVWFGYDTQGLSLGIGQAAASVAAPVWARYMKRALANEPAMDFPTYAVLEEMDVCSKSGLLPTSSCPMTTKEVFHPGTTPQKYCNICPMAATKVQMAETSPDANISEIHRSAILTNIKKKAKSNQTVLENVGKDLLK